MLKLIDDQQWIFQIFSTFKRYDVKSLGRVILVLKDFVPTTVFDFNPFGFILIIAESFECSIEFKYRDILLIFNNDTKVIPILVNLIKTP